MSTLLLPSFADARVLVLGDIMLDRYWYGRARRISPEAPVPVVNIDDVEERPGGAANVALNVSALGATPVLVGVTGDDEAADAVATLLRGHGLSAQLQRLPGHKTITKMRVVSQHQQLIRLDLEGDFAGAATNTLLAAYRNCLPDADTVILSDYGKGTLTEPQPFIKQARATGVPVLVDPKGQSFDRYRGATLITPNLSEFEAVVGNCVDLDDLAARADALRRRLELDAVLVTRGEYGMSLISGAEPPRHVAARAREVYDVTGAGDTVVAVVASGLAVAQPLGDAMTLANVAAGIVVGKLGTASVTLPDLNRAVDQPFHQARGVLAEPELLKTVGLARQRGETVVMTNGCFDILHVGHVKYLEKAKALGHRLLVAVNDDASVRRLKGDGRPINTLAKRMAVLAALQSVDWVVSFSEDSPERLVQAISPHVLVKGGDYRPEHVAGADEVVAAGGRLEILPYEDGNSTTATLEALGQLAHNVQQGC